MNKFKVINTRNWLDNHTMIVGQEVDEETGAVTQIRRLVIGEVNKKPSKTVPNQTLPLTTLVEKYRTGQDVAIFDGQYTGDDEMFASFEHLDTFDKLNMANEIRENIRQFQMQKYGREQPSPTDSDPDKTPTDPDKTPTDSEKVDPKSAS